MRRRLLQGLVALLCLFVASTSTVSAQSYNGLALTPPMGFSSWNGYGCPWLTETLIKDTAHAMATNGMKDAGYQYVNLDDCWQAGRSLTGPAKTHAGRVNGHLVPDPQWFPDGMKNLGDYIHSQGLKFGLYSSHGTATCQNVAGTFGYEDVDARDYASWGIDYFKQDTCNGGLPGDPKAFYTRYKIFSDELLSTARNIVFSLCDFTQAGQTWLWGAQIGNLWRTTGDISASYTSMVSNFTSNQTRRTYAGPGHWNDPDMLEIGNAGHDPSTGGYSTLAAPANPGDTNVQVTSDSTSATNNTPFRIGTGNGAGDIESFIMTNRGTAAGAPTPLFAPASAGDTNIKVASTAGFTVGNKVLIDTIGTTGYNFPVGAGPLPSGKFEGPKIVSVGTPGTATTVAAPAQAGDKNVKVGGVTNLEPGDKLTIDNENATVDSVGTAAGAATTTAFPSAAGDTNVKVASLAGYTVGDPMLVGNERATVTSIGTAAAAETQLVAAAKPGDTNVKVASITGLAAGGELAVDTGSAVEKGTIAAVGTAAGAATTTVAPVFAGDTNIKVSSVTGFAVGQNAALNEPGKVDLGEVTEDVKVTAIGTAAGAATTTISPVNVGDTNLKVASINGFVAGQKLQVMEASGKKFETVAVTGVGTAAGASTTLAAASKAGDTNLKVTSVTGFVVGQPMTVGVGATEEAATVTAVGTAGATGTGITLATPLTKDHLILMLVRGTGTGLTTEPFTMAHASGSTTRGQGTGLTVEPVQHDHPLATTTNGNGQSGAPGGGIAIRGTGTGVTLTAPLTKAHQGAGTIARGLGTGIGITALTQAHDYATATRGLGTGVTLTAALNSSHDAAAPVRDQSKPGTGITFDTPLTAPHDMGAIIRGGGTGLTLQTPVTRFHPLGSSTGASSFTVPEAKSHFSLWAMAAAPLIVGADIVNMARQNLDIVLNQDVIGVDQDTLGTQAFTVANVSNQWTLMRPLANGDHAIAYFNNTASDWMTASTQFSDLDLDPAKTYLAKDLWTKQESALTSPLTPGVVGSHATTMYRVTDRAPSVAGPGTVTAKSVGPNGIAVNYTATGTDALGGNLPVNCTQPSGSVFPIGPTQVTCTSTDLAGRSGSTTFTVQVAGPDVPGTAGGTVPATLALTLGAPAQFAPFTPGVAKDYTATTTANVISTAGDATLSVADPSTLQPGHLVNGMFFLPSALGGLGVVKTYNAPVSNDPVTVTFTQHISATDALRTGAYSKTLTFTLSTTNP